MEVGVNEEIAYTKELLLVLSEEFGHKSASSTFYGYKNHLAMTEECLIAGISVTNGAAPDDQELPKLIEKAQKNGIKVTEVIGDRRYGICQ